MLSTNVFQSILNSIAHHKYRKACGHKQTCKSKLTIARLS